MKDLITYKEYTDLLSNDGISIIELYTPWCTKCTVIKKKLGEFDFDSKPVGIYSINIDSDEFMDVDEFSNISSVPTLFIMKAGRIVNRMSNIEASKICAIGGYVLNL